MARRIYRCIYETARDITLLECQPKRSIECLLIFDTGLSMPLNRIT